LVVECAPPHLLREIAEPFLRKGKDVVALSATALLFYPELIELAKANHCQITLPTGAILGLDALAAVAEGTIQYVRLTTRKPPGALARSPYFLRHRIEASLIKEPVRVFAGTPRDAAQDFPANINVAVTLALAGLGLDKTEFEIWADPGVQRNTHTIDVVADAANFSMTIENVPSDNPSTSKIAALSVIAYLRKLNAPLRIGS
jgi:aspartate dehydrogenase